jgi:hypothetical protein
MRTIYQRFGTGSVPNVVAQWVDAPRSSSVTVGRDWRSVWESASIKPKRKAAHAAAQDLVASLSSASSLITRSCRDFSLGRKRAVPGLLMCIGTLDSTRGY